MFDGFFGWIRQKVKAAVIAGVNDAAGELTTRAEPVEVPQLRYEPEPKARAGNGKAVGRG